MADFKIKGAGPRRPRARTVVAAVLVVAVAILAWTQRESIASVVHTVSQGAAIPLAVAALFELGRVVLHANAFTRSFKVIGASVPLRATVPAYFKMIFMNTVLPSGGTSGMAAVVDTARSRGVAVGSATSATLFTQTCYYSAMLAVIVVGFAFMAHAGTLQARDVLLGCVMGVAALAFAGLLAMGHLAPGLLQRFLRWVERLVVRLLARLHIKKAPKPWADALVHSFSSAAHELSRNPRRALAVFASMLAAMTCDMLAFVAAGFAFDVTGIDALLGGYVTALVFNSFTVTPGGVGVVEGLASAVLAGYGYPASLAVSTVLVYRVLMYWAPFVAGGVMMYATGAFGLGGTKAQKTAQGGASVGERAVAGAEAAAATVAQHMSSYAPDPQASGRRPRAGLRERFVAFVRDQVELRTVACAAAVACTAVAGLVGAALPADPALTEAVANAVLGHGALDPVAMVVPAFLLLACVPGLVIHDQGNWLMAIVGLMLLGVACALSGHGTWVMLLVVAALLLLAVCHGCFGEHGYLKSLPRLVRVLLYCVLVVLAYALLGSLLFARWHVSPDPGVAGALWMGLRSVALTPAVPAGVELGPEALWFFGSVAAMRVTLTVLVCYVLACVIAQRVLEARRPEVRAARAEARAAADRAAAERKAARRARRSGRRGGRRG